MRARWAEALNLVTQGPARLADFTDRGQIAEGLSADLAAVDMSAGTPFVRQAWRKRRAPSRLALTGTGSPVKCQASKRTRFRGCGDPEVEHHPA